MKNFLRIGTIVIAMTLLGTTVSSCQKKDKEAVKIEVQMEREKPQKLTLESLNGRVTVLEQRLGPKKVRKEIVQSNKNNAGEKAVR